MERRTIFKGAFGLAAAAALPLGRVAAAPSEPVLVGVGCVACRPDLYPAGTGKDRLPLSANHYRYSWMRWSGDVATHTPPVVTLGGTPIKAVTELMTGEDGWLIRNFDGPINPAYPSGMRAVLCDCGAQEVKQELWRGPVEQVGIENLTIEEILAARAEEARRRSRFGMIEEFCRFHPEWADQVWTEQRDFPGRYPVLRRNKIHYDNDWKTGYKIYMATAPEVHWLPMEEV